MCQGQVFYWDHSSLRDSIRCRLIPTFVTVMGCEKFIYWVVLTLITRAARTKKNPLCGPQKRQAPDERQCHLCGPPECQRCQRCRRCQRCQSAGSSRALSSAINAWGVDSILVAPRGERRKSEIFSQCCWLALPGCLDRLKSLLVCIKSFAHFAVNQIPAAPIEIRGVHTFKCSFFPVMVKQQEGEETRRSPGGQRPKPSVFKF